MSAKKKRFQAVQEYRSTHKEAEAVLLSENTLKYDPFATTEELIADLRAVQDENPDLFITRSKYRKLGTYSDSTWDSKFGTFREFRRQARLELSRGQHSLEQHIAKHASIDVYRGFAEAEIMPWVGKYERLDGKRWQTMVVASDFHDTECDPFVMEVFLETIKRIQPSIVCLAGDIYDNYEFSKFDKDPRKFDIAGRMRFVRDEIIKPIRERVPSAQIDFLVGNHDLYMLRHMAERTPEMRIILSDFMGLTLSDIMGLKNFEVNLVTKQDLSAFKAADIRAETAKNRKTYFGCVTADHYPDRKFNFGTNWIAGHTHKMTLDTHCNEVLGSVWGITNGCMCKTDNSYTDRNRNQNGFTIVHIDTVTNCAIAEPILFTDNGCIVGGVRYARREANKTV